MAPSRPTNTMIGSKIALGTVQFGMDYGISNRSGRVPLKTAMDILLLARTAGIDTLDTAQSYGDSEAVLGMANDDYWQHYTKLPPVPAQILEERQSVSQWVSDKVDISLSRLRSNRLAGLMLHHPAQLTGTGGQALFDALRQQKDEGRTGRIGISIYAPADLEAMPQAMTFDFVQGPLNILDMRLVESGWVARLEDSGCAFFARSAFLQGLLLMPAQERPTKFDRWSVLWRAWDDYLATSGLTAVEACLSFLIGVANIEKIIIGVSSPRELSEILEAAGGPPSPRPQSLRTHDPVLLNPSQWNSL